MIEALDIDAIWPAPLAMREQTAFRRELADRLADRLAVAKTDREGVVALKRRLAGAWRSNQTELFAGAGLALKRIYGLKGRQPGRLAWALLTLDRFGKALDAAADAADDTHLIWFDRARALAGCKRLNDARQAAQTALERLRAQGPGESIEALLWPLKQQPSVLDRACRWGEARDAMVRAREQGAPDPEASFRDFLERRTLLLTRAIEAAMETGRPTDWPAAARRATACLLLGLGGQALKTLYAAPASAAPLDPSAQAGPLLRVASAGAGADGQPALLRLFARLSAETSVRKFADQALQVISGELPWQDLAAARPPTAEAARMVATALAGAGRLEPAIAILGAQARGKSRQGQRRDLAACINRQTVAETAFCAAARAGPRRVFDLFPYNGEFELLKIKLHEMAPWVDRFVIVESATTFTGQPKPLSFPERQAELEPFLEKIIYLPLGAFPEHVSAPWAREFYQRDHALKALCGLCGPDDIVLLTDVDEVVSSRALEGFDGEMGLLATLTCRFFLNHAARDERPTASIWRGGYLERWGPSIARHTLAVLFWTGRISGAGWHLTSIGDARAIARKLASYSHVENDRPGAEAAYAALLQRIRSDGPEPGWRRAAIEELPAYVQANQEALADLLL